MIDSTQIIHSTHNPPYFELQPAYGVHFPNWFFVSVFDLSKNILLSFLEKIDIFLFHRGQLFHIVVRYEIFLRFPNHLE